MRIKVLAFAASILLIASSSPGIPQSPATTTTSSQQAASLLAQCAKALTGSTVVSDVTLTGTVERIAGSDDENGSATYKALPSANRLDMSFAGGTRSEIRGTDATGQTGTWIGLDGASHSIANHNVLNDPGWFPLFALGNINSSSNSVLTYVGPETRNNVSVIHVTVSQHLTSSTAPDAALMQHLTQVDIYLDPSTYLPVSYAFFLHPDNNALLDIPCEIHYSNYQTIGGIQIPLHIQKFVNSSLALDLHFQTAIPNSGLTAAQVAVQ